MIFLFKSITILFCCTFCRDFFEVDDSLSAQTNIVNEHIDLLEIQQPIEVLNFILLLLLFFSSIFGNNKINNNHYIRKLSIMSREFNLRNNALVRGGIIKMGFL